MFISHARHARAWLERIRSRHGRLDEIGANIPPVLLYPVLYYAVVGAVCCVYVYYNAISILIAANANTRVVL